MNLAFATIALARGNAGSHALVWGSSDDGERGAAVLSRNIEGNAPPKDSAWA
jgi:hypothetical protein